MGRSWSATGKWVPVEAGAEASLDDDMEGSSGGGSARPSPTPSSDTNGLDSVALVSITSAWSVTVESAPIGGVSVRALLFRGGKLLGEVSQHCEICLCFSVPCSEFVPLWPDACFSCLADGGRD